MRIIHLIDYFQPKIGYQETFLAKEHLKMEHETIVVTSDRYYPFPNFKESVGNVLGKRYVGIGPKTEENINIIRLKSLELPHTNLIYLFGLEKTIKKINPDLILCHGIHSLTSYRIAKLKEKLSAKLIYDTHATSFNTNFSANLLKRLYHYILKIYFFPLIKKQAHKIIAVGDDEQQFLGSEIEIPREKIPIIRLGVDTNIFNYSPKRGLDVRRTLNLKKEDILILYAGKITPNKEVDILIKAFRVLNRKNSKLLIIGGNLPSSPHIIFKPFIPNKELPAFYSAADIGVWPGDFSITIYEALGCGLPTIVAKTESTKYILSHKSAMGFNRRDVKELVRKLNILSSNKKKRDELTNNARSLVSQKLSWENLAKQFLEI